MSQGKPPTPGPGGEDHAGGGQGGGQYGGPPAGGPWSNQPPQGPNPYQPVPGPAGSQYPQINTGGAGATYRGHVKSYMVESILSLLFCGGLLAIPAIVYAAQVDSRLRAGDYHGAVQASKNAKTWLMVAVGVASGIILIVVVGVICMGVIGAAAGGGDF